MPTAQRDEPQTTPMRFGTFPDGAPSALGATVVVLLAAAGLLVLVVWMLLR